MSEGEPLIENPVLLAILTLVGYFCAVAVFVMAVSSVEGFIGFCVGAVLIGLAFWVAYLLEPEAPDAG